MNQITRVWTNSQEKLIKNMEISETDMSEDRIAALEQKVPEMEALVKGLIAELLDIKAVARTITKDLEEYNREEIKRGSILRVIPSPFTTEPQISSSVAASPDVSTVIQSRSSHPLNVPAAPAEPAMVRIMQPDGTMKMEARYGEIKRIDSSAAYGRNRKGMPPESKQEPLIYASDKDKSSRA